MQVMVADDPWPAPERSRARSKEEWMRPKPGLFAAVTELGKLGTSTIGVLALVVALGQSSAIAGPKDGKAPAGKPGDMEFEPDNAVSTPPSKTLERAIKLYDK